MENKTNKNLQSLFVNVFVLCFLAFVIFSSLNNKSIERTTFVIEKGMSLDNLTNVLYEEGIIGNKSFFKYSVALRGLAGNIPTGTFAIGGNISNTKLIRTIFDEGPIRIKITLPEGLRSEKVLEKIENILETQNRGLLTDSSFIEQFGIEATSLEGYLFPDTYYFFQDIMIEEVLTIMINQFWNNFNQTLIDRSNELELTIHEVVTLASIIEGEALFDSERRTISSVYHNRLRKNIKLQADPTIQYLFLDGPKTLEIKHLTISSPYNTYIHYGLPPGPINNPGIKSIEAALYPEDTDYLYFVAKGDGYHVFSTNQSDHLKAKREYKKQKRIQ
ncbi:MAG TPA: endolytic transglycosylase MltG [Candidatus Marinimicrobia bacterium]|nr:endolytic transglycosylase MltG [Candidatus Neomarinimicrobiota bacterium]